MNGKWEQYKLQLERNQANPIMLADYPELDYPATLDDAKLRLEQEECRMNRMVSSTGQPKGKTFATIDNDKGGKGGGNKKGGGKGKGGKGNKGDGSKLLSQHIIPEDYLSYKFVKKCNNHGTLGRQLKSSDKPSEYNFMFCPTCSRQGYKRNDHFKFFHDEFMKKVVGKKSEAGSVNAVTKEDFANLGKTIAESLTAGLESLKK